MNDVALSEQDPPTAAPPAPPPSAPTTAGDRPRRPRRRRRKRTGPPAGGPHATAAPAPVPSLPPEQAQKIRDVLKNVFGFEAFRGVQEAVIARMIAGKDAMAVMPTGSGKSLCYQVPGIALEGTALILSPLIALMKDQVDALKARDVRASFINSSLTPRERGARKGIFAKGAYDILYVTPERFEDPQFVETAKNVKINLLAIDEAHCISQWGQDFRPSYRNVGEIRRLLGNPPTIALTATATKAVQRDIRKVLGLTERSMPLFHTGIERPNLYLSARHCYGDSAKIEAIDEVITKLHPDQCGIVYFSRITDLDRIGDAFLSRKIPFERYHGKMHPYKRKIVQEKFLAGEVKLLFATNAFGMGVDKPDIRFVVHAQVPRNPESYYQEVGRAGRDGLPSTCLLLYDQDDLAIQIEFINWANPEAEFVHRVADALATHTPDRGPLPVDDVAELLGNKFDFRVEYALRELETLGVAHSIPAATNVDVERFEFVRPLAPGEINAQARVRKKRRDKIQLNEMVRYVKATECRRAFLYKYFFEKPRPQDDCRTNCDICRHGPAIEDVEKKRKKKEKWKKKVKERVRPKGRGQGRRPSPRGRPLAPPAAPPGAMPEVGPVPVGAPAGFQGPPEEGQKKRRRRRRRRKRHGEGAFVQGKAHAPGQGFSSGQSQPATEGFAAAHDLRFQETPVAPAQSQGPHRPDTGGEGHRRPEGGEDFPRRRRRRRNRGGWQGQGGQGQQSTPSGSVESGNGEAPAATRQPPPASSYEPGGP